MSTKVAPGWWGEITPPRPWPSWFAFLAYVARGVASDLTESDELGAERHAVKPMAVRQAIRRRMRGTLEEKMIRLTPQQMDELVLRTAYRCEASLLRRGLLDDTNEGE